MKWWGRITRRVSTGGSGSGVNSHGVGVKGWLIHPSLALFMAQPCIGALLGEAFAVAFEAGRAGDEGHVHDLAQAVICGGGFWLVGQAGDEGHAVIQHTGREWVGHGAGDGVKARRGARFVD